jgi:hypothetical protein
MRENEGVFVRIKQVRRHFNRKSMKRCLNRDGHRRLVLSYSPLKAAHFPSFPPAAIPQPPIATKATAKVAPVKVAKAPARKVARKTPAKKAAVKAPAKEAAKAISAAPKKRREARKAPAKPGPAIAKTATAKVAPVKIAKTPTKKNATAKEAAVMAPVKEVA